MLVLGTAIGLELLFGLPLIFGVILTVGDTLIFLLIQRYGLRKLETLIFSLLSIITLCFLVELFLSKPNFSDVIQGFIPRLTNESIYTAMAILGATVMPHNFYLHSSVVQSRKFGRSAQHIQQACFYNLLDSGMALNVAFFVNASILIGIQTGEILVTTAYILISLSLYLTVSICTVSAAVFYKNGIVVTELEEAHTHTHTHTHKHKHTHTYTHTLSQSHLQFPGSKYPTLTRKPGPTNCKH